ncbi:MAG TPA: ferritin-like domain-containing protein [Burkholderiales bacterium]
MQKQTQLGTNRTGIQMSPKQTQKMLEEAKGAVFTPGDDTGLVEVRTAYIQSSGPVGSVPPPATAKGAVKSGMKALAGKKAHVLVDRLGERLAFERSGTRLYQAMLTKCRAVADGQGADVIEQLEHYCREEEEHFRLLVGCLEKLGADPTSQTPAADMAGVESTGLMQVVTDPMTSVTQSLHAILVAELADNDAWEELVRLAREFGQDEMAARFREARETEREHLEGIRKLHRQATMYEAG